MECGERRIRDTSRKELHSWQRKMFLLMWTTYASFYLLRVNISVAVPGIIEEFGWSKIDIGMVLSSQFILYAIGQFLNGQFGDRFNARRIITIGLVFSSIMNVVFGFVGGMLTLMVVIWGLNGFFQSMGWGPTVKAMANWFPGGVRSSIAGRLGTSYIIGGVLSWLLAGTVIRYLSWHFTFWIPAVICAGIAFNWYVRAVSSPEECGMPCVENQEAGIYTGDVRKDVHIGFRKTLRITLLNPHVWVAAFGLFGLNIIRYGFIDWMPTYIVEQEGIAPYLAAYESVAFPIAGAFGALCAGWISGTCFSDRKAPVAFLMIVLLGVLCSLFPLLVQTNQAFGLMLLICIGFLTFGPHMLLVTALPADLGTRKATSSVTGFIDSIGYLGAGLTGVGSGYLIERFSWDAAFYFWMSGSVLSAGMMLVLWRHEAGIISKEKGVRGKAVISE